MKTILQKMPLQSARCIKKFLYYFPKGFSDKKYIDWERGYKWSAHEAWEEKLGRNMYKELLAGEQYEEIAKRVTSIESKTNLLFSFEKMALRDAVKTAEGAQLFAKGLYDYVYGSTGLQQRFDRFTKILSELPRKQTRVVTWPVHTVFGMIARPAEHIFLKPQVTKRAAEKYGFDFKYQSKPNWDTYQNLLEFAAHIEKDTAALKPRDLIDIQSFIWVMGSEEYPD